MSTIVLVHGAWQTARTWDLVVPRLERFGHDVHVASLTGLEQDRAALDETVTLETHVRDVARLIELRRLGDVTLVGHSYAGMVITGVAERVPVEQLVYVDAFVPEDGQAAIEFLPETLRARLRAQAAAEPDDVRLRGSEYQLDLWGLKPGAAREFVRARLSDFSIRCFEERLQAPGHVARRLPRAYIACLGDDYPARAVFAPFVERVRAEGWPCHELPSGHDGHVECADEFCRVLDALCRARQRRAELGV